MAYIRKYNKTQANCESQNLAILPALLQTAVLTLLSASIPLAVTLTSVLLALNSNGKSRTVVKSPTLVQFQAADSVHVLAFTSQEELLVAESEGTFTLEDWDEVYETAKTLCCDETATAGDDVMRDEGENKGSLMKFVKSTLEEKVAKDLHWKD
jgi:exosome complex component RRP46